MKKVIDERDTSSCTLTAPTASKPHNMTFSWYQQTRLAAIGPSRSYTHAERKKKRKMKGKTLL